jgi:hypothetical protein
MTRLTAHLVSAALLVLAPLGVEAQDRRHEEDALALARICVSEAGWNCWDTGDGMAIHEVILRGAERHDMRYVTYARAYSRRATGAVPMTGARAWLPMLNAAGTEPANWPEHSYRRRPDGTVAVTPHPPWSRYRESWLAILARAREVVRSLSLENAIEWSSCERPVHDWGGAMDRERAERIGLVEVSCGETQNDFYCRPGVDPECTEASGG